jgi:hypothetical protein
MAENDIVAFKELASGGFREVALTPADIAAASSTHASTHHTGGSDAIAPNNIGAESLFTASSITVSGSPTTLSASRAQIVTITCFSATTVNLPTTGNQYGDRLVVRGGSPVLATITLSATAISDAITAQGQQRSYVWQSTGTGDRWVLNSVDIHTHAAADITSGVLDFDRIQQVLEVEIDGTEGTPTEVDLTTNIVGGNLHALVILLGADTEAYSKVVLPALGAAATGKVTVRVNEFEDASDDFVQIVLDDDTAIFPASSYTEMDPDEELTFRWNDGRWDMDIRPNPSATTAVSIFKPATSGTLALNPMTTAGDIVVGGTSGAPARLALGTASQQLRVNSGATSLEYFTPSAGGTKTYAVFTAEHNQPPATAFATLDTRNSIAVLDFDDAATESAVFVGILPEAASLGSGLIVSLRWMATTATSGDVRWSVEWEKSNTDLDSDSFDTATAATATTSGTSGIVTVTNITCTTIDSLAAGDLFRLRVQRVGGDGADTMTGDAELVAVEIRSAA